MKKQLTIGRDSRCDIPINDPTDVVSRNHATIEIDGSKYYIVDTSRNGTYVNGMKISSQERVPVNRNDEISFAHVQTLDWNLVPKSQSSWVYILIAVAAVFVAVAVVLVATSSDKKAEPKVVVPEVVIENSEIKSDVVIIPAPEKKPEKPKKKEAPKKKAPKKVEPKPEEIIDAIY